MSQSTNERSDDGGHRAADDEKWEQRRERERERKEKEKMKERLSDSVHLKSEETGLPSVAHNDQQGCMILTQSLKTVFSVCFYF